MSIWRRVACWISKATRAQTKARARAPTHTNISTHALTYIHARTHAEIYNGYCFSTAKCLHERASLLRPTYKVVQIWPGLFVCKQVTVCPGLI